MRKILLVLLLASFCSLSKAQRKFKVTIQSTQAPLLVASAGDDFIFLENSPLLGGTPAAIGGTLPYSFEWIPASNLNNGSVANPVYLGAESTQYVLVVSDDKGCSAKDTIQITVSNISENVASIELKVYPNPGSGSIRLVKPENLNFKNTSVRLFDATGKKVLDTLWKNNTGDYLLDATSYSKGQYLLLVDDGTNVISKKILIQ